MVISNLIWCKTLYITKYANILTNFTVHTTCKNINLLDLRCYKKIMKVIMLKMNHIVLLGLTKLRLSVAFICLAE